METAIGVFTSRDDAELAVKELRERGVPDDSSGLTPSKVVAWGVAGICGSSVLR